MAKGFADDREDIARLRQIADQTFKQATEVDIEEEAAHERRLEEVAASIEKAKERVEYLDTIFIDVRVDVQESFSHFIVASS